MKFRIVDFVSVSLVFCILFRGTLGVVAGPVGANLAFAILYSSFFVLAIKKIKIDKANLAHYIFVFYCFLLAAIYPIFEWYGNYFTAFIGFSNLAAPMFFWLMMRQCGIDSKKVMMGIWLILLVNAIGAIIQYFVSPTVFGLVHHNVYSEEEILSQGHVLKRAISFISSPQSLSIAMGVGISTSIFLFRRWKMLIFCLVFFIAGVLTVSKAFYIYLLVSLLWYYRKKVFASSVLIFALSFLLLFVPSDNELFTRVAKVLFYIQNISEYSAFNIWVTAFSYSLENYGYIFGRGIGVFSRGSQLMLDYQIYTSASSVLTTGSTESFIIQIIVELGVVGLIFWVFTVFSSVVKISRSLSERSDLISGVLLSVFVVSFFTPALYGFVTSVIFNFFLINYRGLMAFNK
ncbi:hypothetical protein [Shewanella indica]|uniref:hypothetical protein n=1 Tax=Shewanella indica TaxID=768528 RepID=UPI001CFCC5D6|nr:hypothetical protein [Shewanella indica]